MKTHGLPVEWQSKMAIWRVLEESRIPGGAVKCVDIGRNAGGEGGSLGHT